MGRSGGQAGAQQEADLLGRAGRALADEVPAHVDPGLGAVGGEEGDWRVYVWNVRRGALASVLQGHTNRVGNAQFAHSGYLLATSSWDGTTRLWDAASGEPLAVAPGDLRGSFAPDDCRLAFALGGKVGVWDVAAGEERQSVPVKHGEFESSHAQVSSLLVRSGIGRSRRAHQAAAGDGSWPGLAAQLLITPTLEQLSGGLATGCNTGTGLTT